MLGFFRRKHSQQDDEHELHATTEDVEDEKRRVEESDSDSLRVLQLTKRFGSTTAVDNISLALVLASSHYSDQTERASRRLSISSVARFSPTTGGFCCKGRIYCRMCGLRGGI